MSYLCGSVHWPSKTCSRACANRLRTGSTYDGTRQKDKATQGAALKRKLAYCCKGVCQRCGHENYAILQVHHIIERSKGGVDDIDNLELLCPNCHVQHHLGFRLWGS